MAYSTGLGDVGAGGTSAVFSKPTMSLKITKQSVLFMSYQVATDMNQQIPKSFTALQGQASKVDFHIVFNQSTCDLVFLVKTHYFILLNSLTLHSQPTALQPGPEQSSSNMQYFLPQTQHSLLALRNTDQLNSTALGAISNREINKNHETAKWH